MRTDNGEIYSDFDIQIRPSNGPTTTDNRSRGGPFRVELDKNMWTAKQLAEGADTEFFLCAPAVSLHAFQTQVQILGDFGNRSPLAEEPEYFHSRSLKRSTGEAPAVLGEALSRRAMLLTTLSLT